MLGRVIVLLLLIIVLAGGGIMWFDYLNVIDAKTVLAPVYRLIGLAPRSGDALGPEEEISLDAERLAIRLEALELRGFEMDRREEEILTRRGEIEQMAQELEERQKSLDERENSFNAVIREAEDKERNVEQNARYLTGMDPERAVGILLKMDDQDIIDVFRKTEEIAQAAGTQSVVSYWLSLMARTPEGAARAAELQRKIAGRPPRLN
ncbi:MAG: flagellar protein FlbB [Spirochaetaceae bacterium]|jgi:flagellar protein FlbB|nr:flagellar protein FlbB [Spirochaetaceae bacterium]